MATKVEDEVIVLVDDLRSLLVLLLENGELQDSDQFWLETFANQIKVFDQVPESTKPTLSPS